MAALTVRLPDYKVERLKALSKLRGTSVNRLIGDMTALLLTDFDAMEQLQIRAARGSDKAARGVELLRKARRE